VKQPTELQLQADGMRVVAELVEAAVGFGATHSPTWHVSETGMVNAMFHFDREPRPAELDAWRLVVGAHRVEHTPFQHNGWWMADTMFATFRELSVRLTVTYPCTPVGLAAEAVAA
jgi:hypothetical protein